MKISTFILSIAISQSLLANLISEQFNFKSPSIIEKQIDSLGLQSNKKELKEIQAFKKLEKKAMKNINLDLMSPQMRSLYYIQQNPNNALKAKEMARLAAYKTLKKNWFVIQSGIINENAYDKFDQFEAHLKYMLNNDTNVSGIDSKYYYFHISEWGKVRVSKDLKKSAVIVQYSYGADKNKLEEAAYNIKIQE